MRLRPISFILRSTVTPLENSRHRFVGETTELRWSIGKFRKYLWGSEFAVIWDFSGMKKNWIRDECTSHGTNVEIQVIAVPIRNMLPTRKDDEGVWHAFAIQHSHWIVEGQWRGECIYRNVLGSTLRNGKWKSWPQASGSIQKIEHGCR